MARLLVVWICLLIGLFGSNSLISAEKSTDLDKGSWDSLPENELTVSSPKIDPDAGAEFLYREVKVDDSGENTVFRYHRRAKIFSEAGLAEWDKVDLLYQTGSMIYGIRARVVYPDGTVAYLEKSDDDV
mgnify:CR=1 FL=1